MLTGGSIFNVFEIEATINKLTMIIYPSAAIYVIVTQKAEADKQGKGLFQHIKDKIVVTNEWNDAKLWLSYVGYHALDTVEYLLDEKSWKRRDEIDKFTLLMAKRLVMVLCLIDIARTFIIPHPLMILSCQNTAFLATYLHFKLKIDIITPI